jgi:Domain of unknown function (DUF4476)
MKKSVIILLLACAGFVNVDAQSMLKVRLADNSQINVSVDGRYFNKKGTSITVGELPQGRHRLQIFVMGERRRGRNYEEVIYEGKVKTYRGMITLFYYDPNTREIQIEEQDIDKYNHNHPSNAPGEYHGEVDNNTPPGSRSMHSYDDNAQPAASPAPTGSLKDESVEQLKEKVAAEKTDTKKMNVLKETLNNETFSTFQVGTMMEWLNFESSKVEFAEWAYPKTVDKELFSELENKLKYKNYQDDLESFLKAQK